VPVPSHFLQFFNIRNSGTECKSKYVFSLIHVFKHFQCMTSLKILRGDMHLYKLVTKTWKSTSLFLAECLGKYLKQSVNMKKTFKVSVDRLFLGHTFVWNVITSLWVRCPAPKIMAAARNPVSQCSQTTVCLMNVG
jgi:hypothetical protein